jgi:hypothetical protein
VLPPGRPLSLYPAKRVGVTPERIVSSSWDEPCSGRQ